MKQTQEEVSEQRGTGALAGFMPGNYQHEQFKEMGMPQVKNDQDLMQKLLDIKKQVTIPLRYTLLGYTQNIKGEWVEPEGQYQPLMNKEGINWAVQFVESYCSVEYLISNYNTEWLNYVMRDVAKEIARVLCSRYEEFKLSKMHLWQVAKMVEHKILSILLGALNDGYRRWIGETRQVQELVQNIQNDDKPGFFSRLMGRNKQRGRI